MDRANGGGPGATASRAERFEDEKRRIVETCFAKKDPDGSLQETYITHIRITEFSTHPAAPPPPQARTPDSEKPRVIIIAVRKSGRVRMHKSKENPNGTFSIGKTWNLDDLSRIESFTGPNVPWEKKEWASDTGFLVTIGKPYFWQAQTDKEKKFFIASMIKIYGKYTSGKVPELEGFDQKELDQVMGAGKRPPTANSQNKATPPPLEQQGSYRSNSSATATPTVQSPVPASLQPGPAELSSRFSNSRTPQGRPSASATASPAGSFDSSTSKDRLGLRKIASNNRSQESFNRSQESFAPKDPFPPKNEDVSGRPPRSRNGMSGPGAPGRFGDRELSEPPTQPLPKPPGQPLQQPIPSPQPPGLPLQQPRQPSPQPNLPIQQPPQPQPKAVKDEQPPPERKRPPMDPVRPDDRDLVPPPLSSKRDPVAPPPRNNERISPRKESLSYRPGNSITANLQDRSTPPPAGAAAGSPEQLKPKSPKPEPAKLESPALDTMPPAKSPASVALPKSEAPTPSNDGTTPAPPQQQAADEEEESRPGLGPMIKAKRSRGEIAGAFRKAASAATAATAFKPRPGGAGERLRQAAEQAQAKGTDEPDGITGVVPAPPRPVSRNNRPDSSDTREPTPEPTPPPKSAQRTSNVPEVKLSLPPPGSRPGTSQGPPKDITQEVKKSSDPEAAPQPPPRKSVVVGNDAKYFSSLNLDPNLLDSKSEEFGRWLDYFGWVPGTQMQTRNVDDMKTDLERELNKAQAGGWLARFQEEDERVGAIKLGIDVAMTECEELDNLLTLYSVELSTLSEDIAYIEAQGQGLQVQTANQKLLKKELESLLETCAITSNDLEVLHIAPLDNMRGLEDVESSLVTLFRAMTKIDPSLGGNEPGKTDDGAEADKNIGLNSDYGQMRIVQEKKEMYVQESSAFMQRLLDHMPRLFDQAFAETRRALDGALSKKIDASNHEAGRDILWKYSPLMLYARDVDLDNWNRLVRHYQEKGHPIYKAEFQTVISSWRKNARKMTGEEAELLFTHQIEKQQENVATAARKMTVKRSQTLARALRSPLADGSKAERAKPSSENRSFPYEIFAGVLDDLLPLVEMEQNFIIDFFHATTLEQTDFADAVSATKPRDRRGGDLKRHRLMEPDRELARRVTRSMEVIFAFLDQEFTRLMEWVIGQDPLQGIGVLVTVEKKMADIAQSNQDYLNTIFQKLHGLLGGRFRKFVDDQIRAIEETKVKINKRKGVIAFIRVFPNFSTAVENMLAGVDPSLPIRRTVDKEYDRMLKSMFDSLMVIARENPAVGVTATGGADPEDKEALNFHILLIENMNHFAEETETRDLEVLEVWKENANTEYHEHMGLYLAAVMRRPLGKLLDHLENIEAQLQTGKAASTIAAQPSNSKNIFNKVLGAYDAKEVRKGIEALKKRVEKHFGDADDPALSRDLVGKVLRECENFYNEVENRIGRIVTDIYGGDVLFEWPRADVKAAFR